MATDLNCYHYLPGVIKKSPFLDSLWNALDCVSQMIHKIRLKNKVANNDDQS